METTTIIQQREMYVVKANQLINEAKYALSLQEQRVLAYLISMIRPDHTVDQTYSFEISHLCKTCGLDSRSHGRMYDDTKKSLQNLHDTSVWIKDKETGNEKLVSFVSEIEMVPKKGTVHIKFSKGMEYLLFYLNGNYTQYQLRDLLALSSKYSMRLFELLTSYASRCNLRERKEVEIRVDVDHVAVCLGAIKKNKKTNKFENKYPKFSDLWRFAIKPAVEDINAVCSFKVEVFTESEGRSVTNVIFIVSHLSYTEKLDRAGERDIRLAQMSS